MKRSMLVMFVFGLALLSGYAQASDAKEINTTISGFAKAGDMNDAEKLAGYLDSNYRVVMNRLFGSSEVSIMSREVYLEKIRTKEFGGDTRKVKVENLVINGTTASAKVTMMGKKATFISLITLLKNAKGQWKLVSDVPIVK
ncbi:MAG: nuclear transport factor 2 family protein [Calditrichia bacterium]